MKIKDVKVLFSFVGAVLILINTLLVAHAGQPLVISSYGVSSVSELFKPDSPTWCRVGFGVKEAVQGQWVYLWVIIALLNLFSAVYCLVKGASAIASFFIIIFSLLAFFAGGGFIVGSILCLIGCVGSLSEAPLKETFFGRLFRAVVMDKKLYADLLANPESLKSAALLIIFVNILASFGGILYSRNSYMVLHGTPLVQTRILLEGQVIFDVSIIGPIIFSFGAAILKWLLLSALIYLVVVKLIGHTVEFDKISRTIAFAYAPVAFQVFLPVLFFNEPFLSLYWPLSIFIVTNVWMILALVFSVQQVSGLPLGKTLGVMFIVGPTYWLIVYEFLASQFELFVPAIMFSLKPFEVVFGLVSVSLLLSVFFGVFSK